MRLTLTPRLKERTYLENQVYFPMTELIYNLKVKRITLRMTYSFIGVISFALYQNFRTPGQVKQNRNDDKGNFILSVFLDIM